MASISFLDPDEARETWGVWGDANSRGLHDLPTTSWVRQGDWLSVGDWGRAYNGEVDRSVVPEVIRNASGWVAETKLLLIQSRKNMIMLLFRDFEKTWENLMIAFSESSILIALDRPSGPAFTFTHATGKILMLEKLI